MTIAVSVSSCYMDCKGPGKGPSSDLKINYMCPVYAKKRSFSTQINLLSGYLNQSEVRLSCRVARDKDFLNAVLENDWDPLLDESGGFGVGRRALPAMIRAEFAAMGMLVDRPHPDRVGGKKDTTKHNKTLKRDAYLNQKISFEQWVRRLVKFFVAQKERSFKAMLKGQARSQVNNT